MPEIEVLHEGPTKNIYAKMIMYKQVLYNSTCLFISFELNMDESMSCVVINKIPRVPSFILLKSWSTPVFF